MRLVRWIAFLVSATTVVGCAASADEASGSSDAITGGRPASAALGRSVVQLETNFSGGGAGPDYVRMCTGALLSPRQVLTSAWCVGATESSTSRIEGAVATGDDLMAFAYGRATHYSDVRTVGSGLAVVTLDRDLPNGVPLASAAPPADGAPVTALSYGCVENGTRTSGQLMQRALAWNAWKDWWNPTTFMCHSNDDGTVLLDARGRLVAISASSYEANLVPIPASLRNAD